MRLRSTVSGVLWMPLDGMAYVGRDTFLKSLFFLAVLNRMHILHLYSTTYSEKHQSQNNTFQTLASR